MKHKVKIFISVETAHYEEGRIAVRDYDSRQFASTTLAHLCEQEIEVDVPEFSIVEKKIQILEKVLEAEVKEADKRQANLRMQLNELKCIGQEV